MLVRYCGVVSVSLVYFFLLSYVCCDILGGFMPGAAMSNRILI